MTVSYLSQDPKFELDKYPECGTTGYDGRGWYYFYGGQLWGPFSSEEEAVTKQQEFFNKEK